MRQRTKELPHCPHADIPCLPLCARYGRAPPDDFRFGFKVTDDITLKKFPNHLRRGAKAGQSNPEFLNVDLFARAFLQPCEEIRDKVDVLMFEFSRFWPGDYEHGRDFVADRDAFLGKLPKGWPYAIEMRNQHWLREEYFGCLSRHHVTHVFNSWEAMPAVSEQMALPGSRTNPRLVAARFLLKPGRRHEEAVKTLQPCDKVKEKNPDARKAGSALIAEGKSAGPERKTFIYVNNRIEGNALATIEAMVSQGDQQPNGRRLLTMRRKWNFDDGRAEYEVIALSGGAALLKHLRGRMELRCDTVDERRKLKAWIEQVTPDVVQSLN